MTPAGEPTRVEDRPANGRASEAPTQQLAMAAVSERCVNCGAPLASDQRYCVNCGERRGKPRFTLAGPPDVVETVVTTPPRPRGSRTSAGFNLIAGIATLLLAMGVGVLIGHNNGTTPQRQQQSTVILGGGAGGAAAAAPSTSGASTATRGKTGKGSSSNSAKPVKAAPKVVIQKAAAAAAKVTGGSAAVAGATATQGSSCAPGTAGCQNGKFTGNNFFGQ